jgi:tripartite ATP-independent transporter DctM subunit
MSYLPLLMFPVLFGLIFLGVHVAVALIITSFIFGYISFGEYAAMQLFGPVLQVASNFILAAVPLFILMGAILERSGVARRLFDALQIWLGRLPGGLALTTIAMCAVFAAAAGVVGAVEIVVGLMAIPAMRAYNYDRGLVAGTVCAGGSLGTMIPPSVVVVIYASISQMSIGDLFAAIILPGALMVALFMFYIVFRAWMRPQDAPPVTPEVALPMRDRLAITFKGLVPPLLLIVAVLGSILMGIASPTEAAAVGALGALILAIAGREMSRQVLTSSLSQTINITAMTMFIVIGGTMFTGIFAATGGGRLISSLVADLGLSSFVVVALFLAIAFVLGFVLDWVSIVLICVPIFVPIIRAAGVDPIWFAVLFIIMMQTSYLTPPMAPSIFYLKAIAPPDFNYGHMYRGVIPFVAMQVLTMIAVATLPFLATWLPSVLLR